MQQRRVRLGDIVDDYCPRERRITNHAVVAMIDDTVKQTRCTTCDADHEYKDARVPAARRRKTGALAAGDVAGTVRARPARPLADESVPADEPLSEVEAVEADTPLAQEADADVSEAEPAAAALDDDSSDRDEDDREEWPVHRPLIRATLPRPEGQVPERKAPDFTFRPTGGGRFDAQRNGQRNRHRPMRHAQGQGQGQPTGQGRFGGSRTGAGQQGPRHGAGQGQGQRQGNRQGTGGSRPGQTRGSRPGGPGRKRGR